LTVLGGGALGVALTPPALLVVRDIIRHDRSASAAKQLEQEEQPMTERQLTAGVVEQGMQSDWEKCSVWPGLAIISPEATLYTTPTLDKGSEMAWPYGQGKNQLAVQRPFLIQRSVEENRTPYNTPTTPIGPGVMGFWMPDSEQMAFFDQGAEDYEAIMATNSDAPIWLGEDGFVGQEVTLQPSLFVNNLTWRYLDNNVSTAYGEVTVHKVVGCSAWADLEQAAADYQTFETVRAGDDIVQLPGTN